MLVSIILNLRMKLRDLLLVWTIYPTERLRCSGLFFCITFIRRYLTFEIHSPFLSYYLMDLMYYCKKNYQNVKNVKSKQFVKGMQTIYGVEKVGINIHLLTYLSQCVLNLGCLWSYSTFIPE